VALNIHKQLINTDDHEIAIINMIMY